MVEAGIKLNLGCHKWKIPGWINIDTDPKVTPDVIMDVKKLDYPNDYVEEIYAGHLLEHLTVNSQVLKEWKRVLKPGGKITITVPDIAKAIDLYNKGQLSYDFLIQVVFGNQEVTKHNMVFSEKMLLAMVSKEFPNVKIIDDFEYLVAKINWQTICQATK
jgi:predicted SAM-dependent methyltransferase